ADQNVMEVSDDEECVVHLGVDVCRGQHHAGQPTEDEYEYEPDNKVEWRFESWPSAPQGGQPAEHLDAIGDGDHETGDREQATAQQWDGRGEHVMDPHAEADDRHGRAGEEQGGVAEDWPPTEGRQNGRDDARGRDEDDIHLGVSEKPEQVLPEQGVATLGWV